LPILKGRVYGRLGEAIKTEIVLKKNNETREIITGDDGTFSTLVDYGKWTVFTSKKGYQPISKSFEVIEEEAEIEIIWGIGIGYNTSDVKLVKGVKETVMA